MTLKVWSFMLKTGYNTPVEVKLLAKDYPEAVGLFSQLYTPPIQSLVTGCVETGEIELEVAND